VVVKIFVNGGFAEVTPDKCVALVTEGTPLEALDKRALEIEIKNLLEDMENSKTAEERKNADQHLNIAQAKMIEILSTVK
jgi:F-type H+-transporting ATPase subunit epsilon